MTEYTRENMPDDLRWLAENVSEWPGHNSVENETYARKWDTDDWSNEPVAISRWTSATGWYSKEQHAAARRTLGLDQLDVTEEEEEEWERVSEKQQRYQDATGEDWIDEFARTATPDEFRGAMRFTIGKYNRRMGKKDELVKEIQKMRDYCNRWLEYENAM